MEEIDLDSTKGDISTFIRTQLSGLSELEQQWPDGAWWKELTDKAEGLFQWAFTASVSSFPIKGDGQPGLVPAEQLQLLLSSEPQHSTLERLNQLYTDVLTQTFKKDIPSQMKRFQ